MNTQKPRKSRLPLILAIVAFLLVICCAGIFISKLFSNNSPTALSGESKTNKITDLPTPTPSPMPSPMPTQIVLPLTASSTGWQFVIQQVATYKSLQKSDGQLTPDKGEFLVLIGDLQNNSTGSGCNTDRAWGLADSKTNKSYAYSFYAEPLIKGIYKIDAPGTFLGTCLDGGESKRVFVVFDVDPNAQLTLTFRGDKGGQPVQVGTGEMLSSAPTATITPTPTLTLTPTPTNTSTPTITPTPTETLMPKTATAAAKATAQALYQGHLTETSVAIQASRTARAAAITATREAYIGIATEVASYKEIYWKELISYPDKHIGERVIVRGVIFHVISDSEFQMYISGTYEAIWVSMLHSYTGIYQDTSVVVYGTVTGTQCGTNAFGAEICQPAIAGFFFGK